MPHMEQSFTDQELVAKTLEDPEQFGDLIQRYEDRLRRYVLRISNVSYDDAQDTLQEVFLKVYKNLNSFDQSLSFSSWIYRITHNQVISQYRKKKARPKEISSDFTEEMLERLVSDLSPHKDIEATELAEHIREALSELDIKYREALVLRFFEELSYDEMSDVLRKPVGTVGTLLNRAKKKFGAILKEKGMTYEQ